MMLKMKHETGIRSLMVMAALIGPLAFGAACSDQPTEPALDETALLSVVPLGGATGVDPSAPVVVEFNHPMMDGMEAYADVHEGDVNGPLVPGGWSWSLDHTQLTFTQDAPLKSMTQYVIHIGGGMTDENGHHINYDQNGTHMGGQWLTNGMMQGGQHGYGTGGGMVGGGMGGGMGGGTGMGTGWDNTNGTHGMVFSFTTA